MTYPNVLVMGYLKESGQLTPEWRMKLEHAINLGYQRLLTFEARGGGFDWYPGGQAKTMLTAYGILQLNDMDKVVPIDRAVIDRAYNFLVGRQKGSVWRADERMSTWSRLGSADLPMTAYVTMALLEAGYLTPPVLRAVKTIEGAWRGAKDPYVRALCANALVLADSKEWPAIADALADSATQTRDEAHWKSNIQTVNYCRGGTANLETTALSALALLRGNRLPIAQKAIMHLTRQKGPNGAWGTTSSTILCIKTLMEGAQAGSFAGDTTVTLRVNGREIPGAFETITKFNADVAQQVRVPVVEGENVIELVADGPTVPAYQIFGRYYIPWRDAPPEREVISPIEISVTYDRTTLTRDDVLTADVVLRYNGDSTFMLIADLGIPPGFAVDRDTLEALLKQKRIDKYAMTGRQITLYFGAIQKGWIERFSYTLRPKFPLKVKAPRCEAYEYYTPSNRRGTLPVTLEVKD